MNRFEIISGLLPPPPSLLPPPIGFEVGVYGRGGKRLGGQINHFQYSLLEESSSNGGGSGGGSSSTKKNGVMRRKRYLK